MNKGQYKRFILLIIFVIILLGVTIGLLFAILNKPKDLQIQYYTGKDGKDGQSVVGPAGPSGLTGISGEPGKDGINAETIVQTFTNTVNIPIPGAQGENGEKGETSPQILLKVDYITCKLLTMYEGDDLWRPIAQLPKPCAVEASND